MPAIPGGIAFSDEFDWTAFLVGRAESAKGYGMNSAPASTWFIVHVAGEEGPLESSAIRARVADGRIGPATLLRRGDLAQPVPAARIRGLLPDAAVSSSSLRAAVPTVRTVGNRRMTTQVMSVLPEGSAPNLVPPGRVVGGRRALALGLDMLLVGGLLLGLLVGSLSLWRGSGDEALAEIEALRAEQSVVAVANRGDPRPSYHDWPTVEPTLVQALGVKQAALAAKPSEDEVRRLRQEIKYAEERLTFERNAYARDQARIAHAETANRPLGWIIFSVAVVLTAVAMPLMELLAGGTPGKLLLGQRTVGPGRRLMTPGEAFIRHAGRCLPGIHLSLLLREDGRAVHEAWSKTEVVPVDQVRLRFPLRPVAAPRTQASGRTRRKVA